MPERTVSRVLSRTIIHLGQLSPTASSNLPGSPLGTGGAATGRVLPYLVLLRAGFTVPRTVTSRAVRSYRTFSPLPAKSRRSVFCGTFHGLTPPRRYLAPCPKEPGLSSVTQTATAIAWPTPTFPAAILQQNAFCRSIACSATCGCGRVALSLMARYAALYFGRTSPRPQPFASQHASESCPIWVCLFVKHSGSAASSEQTAPIVGGALIGGFLRYFCDPRSGRLAVASWGSLLQ